MTYFAGLGAGKGWNKFKFILTPDELRNVFEELDCWFVITNSRVPIEYEVTDKVSLFDNYLALYHKIVSGQQWITKVDFRIDQDVRRSVVHDPQVIGFEKIESAKAKDAHLYKLVRPKEPVVNISPFYLLYRDQELSLETFNEEGIIGLELTFPKVVSFNADEHQKQHDTIGFRGKQMFDELVLRIKAKTKKAKLTHPGKTFKPNFWISSSASESINANWYLRQNSLTLS